MDTARLPHQADNQTPGLKIEFESENVRDEVLKAVQNLKHPSPYAGLINHQEHGQGRKKLD